MYVLKAKNSWDVETEQNVVEITTTRWLPGTGWNRHTDFIYTRGNGNWNELSFQRDECVKYTNFLNTMVEKNLEVCRKVALVTAENVVNNGKWTDFLKLMNSLSTLDRTFEPPTINLKCRWQRELLETMCTDWTKMVISTCTNIVNLDYYVKEIESFFPY
jgi:hypothetical protein